MLKNPQASNLLEGDWQNDNAKLLQLLNILSEENQEQAVQIAQQQKLLESSQVQTQGSYSKLARKRPRSLQFNSEEINSSFPSISPRSGSFPADFDRLPPPRSRFNSPSLSPSNSFHSPPLLENIREEEREWQEKVNELTTEWQQKEATWLTNLKQSEKLLTEKDHELTRFETKIETLLKTKEEIQQDLTRSQSQLEQKEQELATKTKENHDLRLELQQTNVDYENACLKSEELQILLEKQYLLNQGLNQTLEEEKAENDELREKLDLGNQDIITYLGKVSQEYDLALNQKEELEQRITQIQKEHEEEKRKQELFFKKQMDNMRLFHGTDKTPNEKLKKLHRHSYDAYSLPNSRAGSPVPFFTNSPDKSPNNLFFQLAQSEKGRGSSKGNFFNHEQEINPFENSFPRNRKLSVASTLSQVQVMETEESVDNIFKDLLGDLDDLGFVAKQETDEENISSIEMHDEEEEEKENLKANLVNLERAWKTLYDENVELERVLKNANENLLAEKHAKEKVIEELAEKSYQLQESFTKQFDLEKTVTNSWQEKAELTQIITDYLTQIKDLNTKLMEQQQKIQNLTQNIADLQTQLEQYQALTQEIITKQNQLKQELADLEKEVEDKDEEIALLQAEKDQRAEEDRINLEELDKAEQATQALKTQMAAQILDIQNLFRT